MGILTKILPDLNKKEVKKLEVLADQIEALEEEYSKKTNDELREKTNELIDRVAADVESGTSMDDALDAVLVEAFANCREASVRALKMKHFKVQLIGGIALHQGRISEMKTGEGKTLVATLPAYLNALSGKGVHVITVNDYLARRDAEWMGKLYNFLGLEVGVVVHGVEADERQQAYRAHITYGTNNEFGFDYLRDNMVVNQEDLVQRELNYAIVDEVDSILIDEARTPLIISGAGDDSSEMYEKADKFVRGLIKDTTPPEDKTSEKTGDFTMDEKDSTIALTEIGIEKAEKYFNIENLSDPDNMEINHHVNQALRANNLMARDIDYVVDDNGEIIIVDEFTGRLMYGRRYSNGLHQAIEAKEKLKVNKESKTLATVTIQNYFRMYSKLAGMTGTAKTEEDEFRDIYNMDVVVIPTNKEIQRTDYPDAIFTTEKGKYQETIENIVTIHETGRPILVGTISIEHSELISALLKKRGVKHNVLNAKNHEKEAQIVAEAGRYGTVTIATNMAGRGTDILLGGNPEFEAKREMAKMKPSGEGSELYDPITISYAASAIPLDEKTQGDYIKARTVYRELYTMFEEARKPEHDQVVELGGLHIIGTERHESRRIDNQLRGRAGRQGDPGSTQFFISMEDDLFRLFGGERMQSIVSRLGVEEGEAIEANMLSRQIENAQKRVEGRNFGSRKYVLQYDNVMNKQREVIYADRRRVLEGEDMKERILSMLSELVDESVANAAMGAKYAEEWDWENLRIAIHSITRDYKEEYYENEEDVNSFTQESLGTRIYDSLKAIYDEREKMNEEQHMRAAERMILLRVIDNNWMDHIDAMDQLKNGIGLRSIGQVDPAQAYAEEGFDMFSLMTQRIKEETVKYCFGVTVETRTERKKITGDGEEVKSENVSAFMEGRQASAGGQYEDTPKGQKVPQREKSKVPYKSDKPKLSQTCPYCDSGRSLKKCTCEKAAAFRKGQA